MPRRGMRLSERRRNAHRARPADVAPGPVLARDPRVALGGPQRALVNVGAVHAVALESAGARALVGRPARVQELFDGGEVAAAAAREAGAPEAPLEGRPGERRQRRQRRGGRRRLREVPSATGPPGVGRRPHLRQSHHARPVQRHPSRGAVPAAGAPQAVPERVQQSVEDLRRPRRRRVHRGEVQPDRKRHVRLRRLPPHRGGRGVPFPPEEVREPVQGGVDGRGGAGDVGGGDAVNGERDPEGGVVEGGGQ